ncbi:MAG TPA: PspC domain-containing protein [Candidatus Saccharimonadia bacterium]
MKGQLHRSADSRMIAGVAGGIAEYAGIEVIH